MMRTRTAAAGIARPVVLRHAGLALVVAGLAAGASAAPPPEPVSPFDLTGFLPYENVAVVAYSTPVFLGWFQADATGRVIGSVAIPAALEGGTHTLQLTGATSGYVASGTFTLLALAASGADTAALWLGVALLGTGGVLLAARAGGRRRAAAAR